MAGGVCGLACEGPPEAGLRVARGIVERWKRGETLVCAGVRQSRVASPYFRGMRLALDFNHTSNVCNAGFSSRDTATLRAPQ